MAQDKDLSVGTAVAYMDFNTPKFSEIEGVISIEGKVSIGDLKNKSNPDGKLKKVYAVKGSYSIHEAKDLFLSVEDLQKDLFKHLIP